MHFPRDSRPAQPPPAAVANIQAVMDLEHQTRLDRTTLERITDLVSATASSPGFIIFHIVWFAGWVIVNVWSPRKFDPFPFTFLTMIVALEAIVLTGFVLMSQDRMTQLADRRAHLDLQVNLLAEEELTAILRVVCLIAEKAGVDVAGDQNLEKLLARTDVKVLAKELTREMATVGDADRPPTS